MFHRITKAAVTCAVLLAPTMVYAQDEEPTPAAPFTAAETTRYMELGNRAITYFFEGHADSLAAMFAPEALGGVGGIDGIVNQMDMVGERAGLVLEVVDDKMTRREGTPQYWWEANFSEYVDQPLVFRFLFNEDGQITGAGMGPKSDSPSDPEG